MIKVNIRPNQIYAVSLPFKILPLEVSKNVVDIVNNVSPWLIMCCFLSCFRLNVQIS